MLPDSVFVDRFSIAEFHQEFKYRENVIFVQMSCWYQIQECNPGTNMIIIYGCSSISSTIQKDTWYRNILK